MALVRSAGFSPYPFRQRRRRPKARTTNEDRRARARPESAFTPPPRPATGSRMPVSRICVLPDEPIGRIRPELYGHFAEHLGACIDEGLWVGEDSPIPNL